MATITRERTGAWTCDPGPLRCPSCRGPVRRTEIGFDCSAEGCGARLPVRDGVLIVRDAPTDDNKIAADFYNGKHWPKVRFWERLFWIANGGERRAREVVLSRLPKSPGLRLLDVAIGDGIYTSWLPEDWSIVGVDVSTTQLAACQRRNAGRDLRLVLGEAEDLPFRDGAFDAVLSNGGFNHFTDPEAALREMARVAKPGAPVIIADEAPDFLDLGHRLGLPGLDRWIAVQAHEHGRRLRRPGRAPPQHRHRRDRAPRPRRQPLRNHLARRGLSDGRQGVLKRPEWEADGGRGWRSAPST